MADDKVDAWMPLWIGEYLADTTMLRRDDHGGYLLLLFAYWRNKGPLADNDDDLAAITKCGTPGEWKKLRPRLERFFTVTEGAWKHGRAEKELVSAGHRKAAAVTKAKTAAGVRWKKNKSVDNHTSSNAPSNAPSNATSIAQALHKDCPPPLPITPLTPQGVAKRPGIEHGNTTPGAEQTQALLEAQRSVQSTPEVAQAGIAALQALRDGRLTA